MIVRLMFSEAGFRLASGGGTGYSSAHGLLTCGPFTGGIWVEFLLVGKHPLPMSGKKADGPMCTAVCSKEHCSGERGEVVPCRSLVWWRCRHHGGVAHSKHGCHRTAVRATQITISSQKTKQAALITTSAAPQSQEVLGGRRLWKSSP